MHQIGMQAKILYEFKEKSAIIYEMMGIRDIFTSLVKLRNAWKGDYDRGYYHLCSHLSNCLFLLIKKRWRPESRHALSNFGSNLDYYFDYRDFIYYTRNDSLRLFRAAD